MDSQLQSVLEETLNSFFLYDFSLNDLLNRIPNVNVPSIPTNISVPQVSHRQDQDQDQVQEETKSESGDSLPGLIPIDESHLTNQENVNNNRDISTDRFRKLKLWSDLTRDYHTNMSSYQKNMESILKITENVFEIPSSFFSSARNNNINPVDNYYNPISSNSRSSYPSQSQSATTLNQRLMNLLYQTPPYVLEFETYLPLANNRASGTRTNQNTTSIPVPVETPTAQQIQNATTLFNYDPIIQPLTTTICPITLEEFITEEQLMRINACGHIFKANALHRWFVRNKKCPSCRHDITIQ
jgi:hypothetical protein